MFSPRKKHTGKENLQNEVASPSSSKEKEGTPKTPLARFRRPLFSSEKKTQSPAPSTPQASVQPTVLEAIGSARKIQTESVAEPLKVYLRIRPLHDHESPESHCLKPIDEKNVRIRASTGNADNTEGLFTFTGVFEEEASQQDVYEVTTAPLVQAFLSGVNSMVMAYGASGSGKTHTISGYDDELGILPRTLHAIFHALKEHHDDVNTKHFLSLSVLEIHNERIFDLLEDPSKRAILKIHENQYGVNYVKNLKEVAVHTFQEATSFLESAVQRRQVGRTEVNSESSRSHLVINIILRQISELSENGNGLLRESKMAIMDLAGSENNKKTKTTGLLLTESSNINKSLSVFKRCIESLKHNQEHKNRQVVPYRDSQLTQLMKEYFTNGKTCMIVNVSPSDVSETFNVLKFSAIASHVRTSSRVNCGQILKRQMDEDSHYAAANSIESDAVDEAEIREQLSQEMKQAFEKMECHFKSQMSKEAQSLEQSFAEKAFVMQQELNAAQVAHKSEVSQLNQKLLRAEADLACKIAEVEHLQQALQQAAAQQQELEALYQTQVSSLQDENTKLKAQVEDLKIVSMKYEAPPPYQHPIAVKAVAPPMSNTSESETEVKKRHRDFDAPEEYEKAVGSPMKAKRFHKEPEAELPHITSMSRSAPIQELSSRMVGGVPIARRIRKAA